MVTGFDDVKARAAHRHERCWLEVVDALSDPPERPSKSDCKLLKLATFGEVRSAKGSLRHDANVLQVFGIAGDYDAGVMTPAEAAELLAQGGVESLVYTTPSHKLGAPRWRVLCPLSSSCSPTGACAAHGLAGRHSRRCARRREKDEHANILR